MRPRRAVLLIAPSPAPAFLQNAANCCNCHTSGKSPVSLIIATDSKVRSRKSFVCHTYDTPGGCSRVEGPTKYPNWWDRKQRKQKDGRPGASASSRARLLDSCKRNRLFVRGAGVCDAGHDVAPAVGHRGAEERVAIGSRHFAERGVNGGGPPVHAFRVGIGDDQAAR